MPSPARHLPSHTTNPGQHAGLLPSPVRGPPASSVPPNQHSLRPGLLFLPRPPLLSKPATNNRPSVRASVPVYRTPASRHPNPVFPPSNFPPSQFYPPLLLNYPSLQHGPPVRQNYPSNYPSSTQPLNYSMHQSRGVLLQPNSQVPYVCPNSYPGHSAGAMPTVPATSQHAGVVPITAIRSPPYRQIISSEHQPTGSDKLPSNPASKPLLFSHHPPTQSPYYRAAPTTHNIHLSQQTPRATPRAVQGLTKQMGPKHNPQKGPRSAAPQRPDRQMK